MKKQKMKEKRDQPPRKKRLTPTTEIKAPTTARHVMGWRKSQ